MTGEQEGRGTATSTVTRFKLAWHRQIMEGLTDIYNNLIMVT